MLKCASVFTCELDAHEVAVAEIKSQLEQKLLLLEHSIGIIMCHPEFIANGTLTAVCENLPFETVGITSPAQAVNEILEEPVLTIFVMTSDDILFKSGLVKDISEDVYSPSRSAYDEALHGCGDMPSLGLVIIFPPFIGIPGDSYVDAWKRVTPGIPIFGGFAADDSITLDSCETIINGTTHKASMPFLMCFGEIRPRFMFATLSPSNDLVAKGIVTKASGTCVQMINDMKAFDFFKSLDFFQDRINIDSKLMLTPIFVDLVNREDYDGIPVVRGHHFFTEDGAASFLGVVDEGAAISLTICDTDDILNTTTQKASLLATSSDINGMLAFACLGRRVALMGINNPMLELQAVKDAIGLKVPFMMGYVGGEICPTSVNNGVPTNRFHNYTLVMLVL